MKNTKKILIPESLN